MAGFILTPDVADRWQVSGRIVYNNKQKPVKQYEPFYSATHEYDDERFFKTYGVTPLIHYDPLARVIQTDKPHRRFSTAAGTVKAFFYSKVEFTPWEVRTYDENDTVLTTAYFKNGVINPALALSAEEIETLNKAKNLANLPAYVMLDSLGREFLQYMVLDASQQNAELYTFTEFDITGKPLKVTDPKQYQLNKSRSVKVYTYEYTYDMSGTPLVIKNIDSGEAKSLADVLGNPLYSLDAKLQLVSTEYDGLRRPVATRVDGGDYRNQTVEYIVYGENAPEPELYNLRGKIYRHYDQAGLTEFASYSFKGELLTVNKQLKVDYKFDADWSVDNLENKEYLEGESFSSVNKYDALGRIIEQTNPDNSVFAPEYHQSGKLNKVAVKVNEEMGFAEYVSGIIYNPKGQREKIVYGNNTFTEYVYERESFRLIRQKTTRTTDSKVLQDLNYWYDPAGNIIKKVDNSQQDVYFNNQVVKAENNYIYDALNRLIEANGREHGGQSLPVFNSSEIPRQNLPHANAADALRNYTRKYSYDNNGNIAQFKHLASNNVWTNNYTYDQLSNKLAGTVSGSSSLTYSHDDNGNIISLGGSKNYIFDYRNNIQSVDLGGGGIAYYIYDGSGQRVRKVIDDTNGAKQKETIYLGGFEIFRQYRRGSVDKEIQTLHVMDDKARVALIETTTVDMSRPVESPVSLSRYQYSDHLGSSCIEADENGSVISFEEYFPFGGTSYHSVRAGIEVNTKKYRYNGKEKDTESGLYYYGARYYAPWLGRWMSADPSGPVDGLNLYAYVKNNPVGFSDPDGRESIDLNSIPVTQKELTIVDGNNYYNKTSTAITNDAGKITGWNTTEFQSSGTGSINIEGVAHNTIGAPYEAPSPVPEAKSRFSTLDIIQTGLDVIGLIPGIGEPADVLNAGISAARGNYIEAAANLTSAIPFAGMFATVGKWGKKAAESGNVLKNIAEETSRVRHYTNRKGINGIEEQGNIISKDHDRVYVESAKKKPLSQMDAEKKYELKPGKGRDYVEFDVPTSLIEPIKNPKYGRIELTIKGNIQELLNPKFIRRK